MFPFLARTCKNNGMNKYLYIAVLVPALVLPAVPGIAGFATGGFGVRQFPPSLCATKNGRVLYYTLVLPMSAMTVIGTSLLILVISELIKVTNFKIMFVFRCKMPFAPSLSAEVQKKAEVKLAYQLIKRSFF